MVKGIIIVLIIGSIFCCQVNFAQEIETFTDIRDGQVYSSVTIGTQTWMAENLNYETTNSWCYNDSVINCEKYGRLYTWDAALNACPANWHLPSEEEWVSLELHLGMTEEEVKIIQYRGDGEGTKLKSETEWEVNNGENQDYNTTGFNALPGGFRLFTDSTFTDLGIRASWWSSTPDGRYAMRRTLFYDKSGIDRDPATRALGFSVRCVKD